MRALQVTNEIGPSGVELVDLPEPDGLVVAVRAAAVSFPDLLMTHGRYQVRQPLPFTLGWEAAGDVLSVPPGVDFAVGDRVMTLTFGTHAALVAAKPEMTFALPEGLSYEEGAAMMLNYLTALAAVERRGRLRAGEKVLVHGAAGGVGTAAIQVARSIGATVTAVVSTPAKAHVAEVAGAHTVIIGEDFRTQVADPVDLIIDPVGGQNRFIESTRSLAVEGRLVVVGFTSGEIPEIAAHRLLNRNIDIVGCGFGILASTPERMGEAVARLTELTATGGIRPIIGSRYALSDGQAALVAIEERRATGKLVLIP